MLEVLMIGFDSSQHKHPRGGSGLCLAKPPRIVSEVQLTLPSTGMEMVEYPGC